MLPVHSNQNILDLRPTKFLVMEFEIITVNLLKSLINPFGLGGSFFRLKILLNGFNLNVWNFGVVLILYDLSLWQVHIHNLFVSGFCKKLFTDPLIQ